MNISPATVLPENTPIPHGRLDVLDVELIHWAADFHEEILELCFVVCGEGGECETMGVFISPTDEGGFHRNGRSFDGDWED